MVVQLDELFSCEEPLFQRTKMVVAPTAVALIGRLKFERSRIKLRVNLF